MNKRSDVTEKRSYVTDQRSDVTSKRSQFMNIISNAVVRSWRAFLKSSLWLVQIGLMVASSGIDGEYMSLWMPPGLRWTGYVMNAVLDFSTAILMYWYGILQRDPSSTKRKRSRWVLFSDFFAALASWFFSWRQLRRTLPAIEPDDWEWVAWASAAVIPIFLAAIGYTQSLLVKKIEEKKPAEDTRKRAEPLPAPSTRPATIADWRGIMRNLNGSSAGMTAERAAELLEAEGLVPPSRRTLSNYARIARERAAQHEE